MRRRFTWFVPYKSIPLRFKNIVYFLENCFYLCEGNVTEQGVTDSSFIETFDKEIKRNFLNFKQIRFVESGLLSHRSMCI